MNPIDRLLDWLGLAPVAHHQQTVDNPIHDLLSTGQRAKCAEDYDTALDVLNRAATLAEARHDLNAQAAVALHLAEVHIYQECWAEAEQVLLNLRRTAQNGGQRIHMAYTLDMLGLLAQSRGDWGEARAFYEQALKVARTAGSLGGEGRALGHLADTYLEEGNASYAAHLLREALPKLNASGDIELGSYFAGQLGRALILTGQENEGDQLLQRALRLAEQVHHKRFERLSALMLGERAVDQLRYEEAYRYYQRALATLKSPAETADVLCRMSKICLHLKEVEQALTYAQEAVNISEASGDFSLIHQAAGAVGMALRARRQSEKAIPYLQRAADYFRRQQAVEARRYEVDILRNLGAARADTGDADGALAAYRTALELAHALDQPLEIAQTHLELGLVYAERKMLQTAIQEWSAALVVYEGQRYFAQVARLRCDIGAARKQLGQGQRAMKEFEHALMTLNSVDDSATRGVVLSNVANAYADYGDYESAESFFTEAITIAARTGDRAAEATRRGNYGWFLLATARPQQAASTLEHAIRISQEQKLDLPLAVQMGNLGLAYHQQGNYNAALRYYEQALDLIDHLDQLHWKSVIQINAGHTHLALGHVDEASLLFDLAFTQGQSDDDIEIIIRTLTARAQVALVRGALDDAGLLIDQAIQRARRGERRRLLAEALSVHSEQQAAQGDIEKARSLWDEASKLFALLRMPGAKTQPAWLTGAAVK